MRKDRQPGLGLRRSCGARDLEALASARRTVLCGGTGSEAVGLQSGRCRGGTLMMIIAKCAGTPAPGVLVHKFKQPVGISEF